MIRIRIVLLILTYCIALLGFIPLFPFLGAAPRFLFAVAFITGVLADHRDRHPRTAVMTASSILFFIYYGLQFSRNNIIDPAASSIILLLGVRLVGDKSVRNHLQIFVLALIALAASSLYNLNAVFLVYLLVQVLLITVSLVLLTFHGKDCRMTVSRGRMNKILGAALLIPVSTIPLTVLFFVILPRTQYPLWQFVQQPSAGVSGFSEKVEPGATSATAPAKVVAFRAECNRLDDNVLYWRGIVLNHIIGDTWVRTEPPAGEQSRIKGGTPVRQTIYPEPSRSRYLITLNLPQKLTGIRMVPSGDLVFSTPYRSRQRVGYSVESITGGRIDGGKIRRNFYLKLPTGITGRMEKLAADLKGQSRDELQLLDRLRDFYTKTGFTYMTNGLPTGSSSMDTFLFQKRQGNCELFAVSAGTLLRMTGVPTRLVGGYLGGEYNSVGGYYTVTEDLAHVWLEVYEQGVGWVTVDPTRWAINPVRSGTGESRDPIRQLKMYLDVFSYYWNRAVITYDLERQISLADGAGRSLKEMRLRDLRGLVAVPVAVAVIFALIPLVRRKWGKTSEEKMLAAFLVAVRKRYDPIGETGTFGLFELADRTGDLLVKQFVAIYGEAVYHGRPLTTLQIEQLKHILSQIKQRPCR
jgi:transglutaminase-like putative cysteine protease